MTKPQHELDYETVQGGLADLPPQYPRAEHMAALTRLHSEAAKVPGLEAQCLSLKESVDNLRTERAALLERLAKAEAERDAARHDAASATVLQEDVEKECQRVIERVATLAREQRCVTAEARVKELTVRVEGALAALSQPACYPGDVRLACSFLADKPVDEMPQVRFGAFQPPPAPAQGDVWTELLVTAENMPEPLGHSHDFESGEHEEDCARCFWEGLQAKAKAVRCALPAHTPPAPVPMALACPHCGTAHVDTGEWATRPHRTHLCLNTTCGKTWRPHDFPTVGVATLTPPAPAHGHESCPDNPCPGHHPYCEGVGKNVEPTPPALVERLASQPLPDWAQEGETLTQRLRSLKAGEPPIAFTFTREPPAQAHGVKCGQCKGSGTDVDTDEEGGAQNERRIPCSRCNGSGQASRPVSPALVEAVGPLLASIHGQKAAVSELDTGKNGIPLWVTPSQARALLAAYDAAKGGGK